MGREQQQAAYTVEQLVAVNPYNPDILTDLENYVNEQALMAMPAPDFSLCLFLIPEQVLTASIQVFLVLNCVFVLRQAINIEGLSLDKFLEYHVANSGWVLEKGHSRSQLMVLPRNEFNHPELKKNTVDGMPFEHVTRIFPILS
ncbi:hypothetical protein BHE74_00047278 [Ensete ventricosum]|nr:hypothetical protein GW17_00038410 [Ensete ventricosum]RWW46765.1 hypothetical protein BHE74_00047278 [Ensete ventricosum]RZS27516.1 hypothetical protein BHM03_00061006 [Ensete ventricosum]